MYNRGNVLARPPGQRYLGSHAARRIQSTPRLPQGRRVFICFSPRCRYTAHPVTHNPGLPTPRPLQTAVDAGVFGWDDAGPYSPTAEHVRSVTEEHAREMLSVLADLGWLERCAGERFDPQTGAVPRGSRGTDRINSLPNKINRFRQFYDDLLAVYEEAFGDQAAGDLDRFVRSHIGIEQKPEQRMLF